MFVYHGSEGRGPLPGLELGQRLLVEVGPLLGLAQLGLRLAVLGQIQRRDLLGLLNLLLVRADLALQLRIEWRTNVIKTT